MIAVVSAWALVGLTVFRVIHLWAGTIWVDRHVREWLRKVIKRAPSDRFDFEVIADAFDSSSGHNRFMIFGVKSYRLTRAALRLQRSGRVLRASTIKALQKLWRFFFYPLTISALLLCITFVSRASGDVEIPVLIGFLLLAAGCLGIVVEAYYSYSTVGTWATWYHRHHGLTSATFELSERLLKAGGRMAREAKIADGKKEAKYLLGTAIFIFFPSAVASLCAAIAFSDSPPTSARELLLKAVPDALGFIRFDLPSGLSAVWILLVLSWLAVALAFILVALQRLFSTEDLTPLD